MDRPEDDDFRWVQGRLMERGYRPHPHVDADRARVRKKRMTDNVKPRILRRDGDKCRACVATSPLNLAHITPMDDFLGLNDLDFDEAIRLSFREDNLLILCRWCHVAYDMGGLEADPDPRLAGPREALTAAKSHPNVFAHHDFGARILEMRKTIFGWTETSVLGGEIHHPPLVSDRRRDRAIETMEALIVQRDELGKSQAYRDYLTARGKWGAARRLVTLERRQAVRRIVSKIEADRGWREPEELRALLAEVEREEKQRAVKA